MPGHMLWRILGTRMSTTSLEVSEMPFHVVIAGGGVAGLETALALRALAEDLVSVEVIAPETEFTYRALAVAEPFRSNEVRRFPLPDLVEGAGATLRRASVAGIDPERKSVSLADGEDVSYDAFVLALGARAEPAVAGALTFRGPEDDTALTALLEDAASGKLHRIAFVVPAGISWPLPLYELALMTGSYLTDHGTRGVDLVIVTSEEHPLGVFGREASAVITELLELRGIEVQRNSAAIEWRDGALAIAGGRTIEVDAAVAMPRLLGPALPGLPHDGGGFVPVDVEGRVTGLVNVYAAGDATTSRPKQGGLATQQADAAAAAIARDLGADVKRMPFRPVLRGLLLTGFVPRYLRADIPKGTSVVDTEPLWQPSAKIVGRYLAPYLADHLGLATAQSER